MTIERSYITLKEMRFYAFHGVLPQERISGGNYAVSLRVKCDLAKAVATDRVDDTLNYADLYELVREEMRTPSNLIEHVAGRIGQAIFARYPAVEAVTITVTKENPPMGADCDGASVELHLTNDHAWHDGGSLEEE